MHNRNLPLNVQLEQNNDKMKPLHNNNPLFDNSDHNIFYYLMLKVQNIQEKLYKNKWKHRFLIKIKVTIKIKYPEYKIYSSKRTNIQSSRP